MLTVFFHNISTASNLLKSGYGLSQSLKKEFGLLCYVENESKATAQREIIEQYVSENKLENVSVIVEIHPVKFLASDCEDHEVSFLMIQCEHNRRKQLRNFLKYCRDLRIPYLFFRDRFPVMNLSKVLVPVGFLVEEYEKAQFASAFGRFCGSEITLLQANDYGSKAAVTVEKMQELFVKFQLHFSQQRAKSDSFKLDREALKLAEQANFGIVLISASRDYGPDDLLFGPPEYHLVKKSNVPLLLVNPRGDLYTLCD